MSGVKTEVLLAYETGVHIGDGNLYLKKDRMYRVTYSGNLRNEKEYYRNVLRKNSLYSLRSRTLLLRAKTR